MDRAGPTWVGPLHDEVATIRFVVCDPRRSVRIGATDLRRKAWSITHSAKGIDA